ncbi:MAG TPA: PPOX class F420-dependent oxidoreductase [Blastocatellia bacterium]
MSTMTSSECREFLSANPHTAKLATVRQDGRPHVVPVWFELDGDDIVFTTGDRAVKATNIRRDPRVCICVDDEEPPFTFVQIEGRAETSTNREDLKYWATRIAGRYMGADQAEAYGRRNSGSGELLVRVKPVKITGEKDIAGW